MTFAYTKASTKLTKNNFCRRCLSAVCFLISSEVSKSSEPYKYMDYYRRFEHVKRLETAKKSRNMLHEVEVRAFLTFRLFLGFSFATVACFFKVVLFPSGERTSNGRNLH
jgi:hypothetical protein